MQAIELKRVQKSYGQIKALDALNLNIHMGQLTALLGPNGAGKTTAISLIQGVSTPTKGSIQVLGKNPKLRHIRAQIGSMPQESALPPHLTVQESISLFASFYPHPLSLDEVLKLADLKDLAHRRAGKLSGGQKRRLAFALAIVGNPQILLIDEPTTGMDAESRNAFWDAITQLKQAGRTILLTTHYLEEAQSMADRVVVMNAGQILADGTPEQLRHQVAGAKVAFTSDLVLAELNQLPGVQNAKVDDKGYALLTTHTPEQLLKHLVQQNIEFSELEVTRATLEDAFLHLTSQEAHPKHIRS